MRAWVDPGNNLVMADVDGNIGYLLRGQLPLRGEANGWLPVPGWTGEHEWHGQIPFEEMPRSHNPAAGYIVTANNRIVGDDYPYYLALDYAPPYRADRIIGHLQALTQATVADMAAIHADKFSTPSRIFVGLLDRLTPRDAASAEAKRRLQAWDGTMGPESSAAALYAVWREQTIGLLLQAPALLPLTTIPAGEKPPGQPVVLSPRVRGSLLALMQDDDTTALPAGETWPTLLAEALTRATRWLTEKLGPDMDTWQWCRIHRTAPKHVLAGTFQDLAELLNPPSVGVGGDGDTPQVGGYLGIEGNNYAVTGTSVTRYVFDLADWDRSAWVVPLGASGHPGSPHYADQVAAWGQQRLFPMAYSTEAVDRAANTRQRLQPIG